MAERRMFAKTIIDSDAFLDMPMSTQCLYFHLAMRADDDGFLNNPRKIQRMIGAGDDDLRVLISKRFLLPFESGVVVIKHWKIHNYIRMDRYKPTVYQEELAQLTEKDNGAYTLGIPDDNQVETIGIPDGNQTVYQMDTQVRLGKDRLVEDSTGKDREGERSADKPQRARFIPPTLDEVSDYCRERNNGVDPQHFLDYYSSNGWRVGKNPMKDWKAAVRTWERNGVNRKTGTAAELEDSYRMIREWANG